MAKSVRASVSKRNRANLRKKVFGPVVDARTERLAAKLQELASQPRPEAPEKSKMDLEDDSGIYPVFDYIRILAHFLSQSTKRKPLPRPLKQVKTKVGLHYHSGR
jgi:hypothetical protein